MRNHGKDMYSNFEANAVQRVSHLPLVRSALQSVSSAYMDMKGRYPLLGLVGSMAEISVRTMSMAAVSRAYPLMQSLEPQIRVANDFACFGLDQLENNFPVLHQSTDEVMGHVRDALYLTMDDVQMLVVDGLDGALDYWERLSDAAWAVVRTLQESQVGRMATSGLDDVLSHLEDATAYYLPLPPTLRLEWEMRIQQYEDEDEDEDDELRLWTRFRGLLLCLSLQLHHRMLKLRDRLERAIRTMGEAGNAVGLAKLLEVVDSMLQLLQLLLVALVYQVESLRELALAQLWSQARLLAELGPIRQALELPTHVRVLVRDLQELSKILLQLLVNSTPLYNMLQQPSEQEVEDFLNQEVFMSDSASRRSSASSLFLKAMDGRPRRRRSLYTYARRGSVSGANNLQVSSPPKLGLANGRRGSLKQGAPVLEMEGRALPSYSTIHRRASATEQLLGPIVQLVSQSQKAFEYLSPGKHSADEPSSVEETAKN